MSKQKILTIAGVALLVILVIVTFVFKGKYDDTAALLTAAKTEASAQQKEADTQIAELTEQLSQAQEQLTALQTEAETAKTAAEGLTADKEAAERLAAELEEAAGKETAEKLKAAEEALAAAQSESEEAAGKLTESEAALKEMTAQYNRAKADLDAKITRYNIIRESHAKLAEKYDLLKAELEAAQTEEVEYIEPERYESQCGVSFVLPEGAEIGNESSKMVEILLSEEASIRINVSTDRVNILWFDADLEAVNQVADTLVIK